MARIEMEGFDELNKLLEKMTLTEDDEKKAIQAALEPVKEEVIQNTPEKTGRLRKSVRTQVVKEDGQVVGKVIMGEYYGRFLEYGTSKSSKHKGFFERSIRQSKSKAMVILKNELLDRMK